MSSGQDTRRNFQEWKVDIVYRQQDGACPKCGSSLENGFHRHHEDGDHSNNSVTNLELHCAECHRAEVRSGEGLQAHRDQEELVLGKLNTLITQGLNKEISGAAMERLIDAMTLSLRVSRNVNEMDLGIERPPTSIVLARRLAESRAFQDIYREGLRDGMRIRAENDNGSS
jgi:hypothetical protein